MTNTSNESPSIAMLQKFMPFNEREELPRSSIKLKHTFGFDAIKRNNVQVLDRENFVTSVGNAAVFYTFDPETGKITNTRHVFGPDLGGIGCICVHPSKKYVAIGCCLPKTSTIKQEKDESGEQDKQRSKSSPSIYIYEFPSLNLHKVLREGTEQGYSCIAFSAHGDKLASVGKFPDFLLTTWNWEEQKIILRTKAFAQEVYNVSFSPINDGFLVTSGMGHIRFWKMAKTFTGLKLQGDIGKFGKVELSDVSAYAEMPDGKVLSGSESGSLLLWDGNFIKLEIRMPGDKLPHAGEVQVCMLLEGTAGNTPDGSTMEFLTAGDDGYFRWWSFDVIDNAELGDNDSCLELSPLREVHLRDVKPRSLVIGDGFALIQDMQGAINRLEFPFGPSSVLVPLLEGHAGPITGMDMSPDRHLAATTGADKTVRLWDYGNGALVCTARFPTGGTDLQWVPPASLQGSQVSAVVVGFENGVIRVLGQSEVEWKLVQALKPHNAAVTTFSFSPDGKKFATAGKDGTVFFFTVSMKSKAQLGLPSLDPVGFVETSEGAVARTLCWSHDSCRLIAGLPLGKVEEFTLDQAALGSVDNSTSFQLDLDRREFTFERRDLEEEQRKEAAMKAALEEEASADEASPEGKAAQKPSEEEKEEEEREVAPVGDVVALEYAGPPGSHCESMLVSLDGADAGVLHKCDWDSQYALAEYPGGAAQSPVTCLRYSRGGEVIATCGPAGIVQLRCVESPQVYARTLVHGSTSEGGAHVGLSHDNAFLASSGNDGGLFILQVDFEELAEHARLLGEAVKTHKPRPAKLVALDEECETRAVELSVVPGAPEACEDAGVARAALELSPRQDISDDATYSIQDAKLKAEQDNRRKAAEEKKNRVREEVEQLQQQFEKLMTENEDDIPEQQLSREEMTIDPDLDEILEREGDALVDEVVLTMQFETRKLDMQVEKLNKYYFDRIEVDKITIGSFNCNETVSSFRTLQLPDQLTRALNRLAQEEEAGLHLELRDQLTAGIGASSKSLTDRHSSEVPQNSSSEKEQELPHSETLQSSKLGTIRNGKQEPEKHHGWELRKTWRKQRKKDMDLLLQSKPNENDDDPQDLVAIQNATENMGDYKLKTAPNYTVPTGTQINATIRRKSCLLLADSIRKLRSGFNKRFLSLRSMKEQVTEAVQQNVKRIREIDETLDTLQQRHKIPQLESLLSSRTPLGTVPTRVANEFPEERFSSTDNNQQIISHEQKQIDEVKNLVEARSSSSSASLTSGDSNHEDGSSLPSETYPEDMEASAPRPPKGYAFQIADDLQTNALDVPSTSTLSDEDIEDIVVQASKTLFERENLVGENAIAQETFDMAVSKLRREKLKLEADLKVAELRQITEYEGLVLLRAFEKKDTALADKLENCKQQKSQVVKDIAQCRTTLEERIAEIENWKQLNEEIISEFDTLVGGETFQFYAPLLKIFKKRVKRSNKRNKDGNEDGESSEEESESEDDYNSDSDEDMEDEEEEDACPLGCDPTLYDKVIQLREKRLDQEEALTELRKLVEELKKSGDRFQGKEKQIDKDLKNTLLEIDAFQNEKQRELNKITVHIALTVDQLRCLDIGPEEDVIEAETNSNNEDQVKGDNEEDAEKKDAVLAEAKGNGEATSPATESATGESVKSDLVFPSTIEEYILFGKQTLVNLHNRIPELEVENHEKKREYRNLHLVQKKLGKERVEMEDKIASLEARCNDLQMLKFGQLIDIDSLEKMEDGKNVIDLKKKIVEQEATQQKDLIVARRNIREAQEKLLEETRQNTAKLQDIAGLTERQHRLESELNSTAASVQGREGSSLSENGNERKELVNRVRFQAQEIEALKAEIIMLRRKDGTAGFLPPSAPSSNQQMIDADFVEQKF